MTKKYLPETAAYLDTKKKNRILFELYSNAYRTIKSVYLFQHFEEYSKQLQSDKNEDKGAIYWRASYDEKLMDYVKISIAFETYNKAVLLKNDIVVHKVKKMANCSDVCRRQAGGQPISVSEVRKYASELYDRRKDRYYLDCFRPDFKTINYSTTLNDFYQAIIGLDPELRAYLAEINQRRNHLHFFTEFKGAFEVSSHIRKWQIIKELSEGTLKAAFAEHIAQTKSQ